MFILWQQVDKEKTSEREAEKKINFHFVLFFIFGIFHCIIFENTHSLFRQQGEKTCHFLSPSCLVQLCRGF